MGSRAGPPWPDWNSAKGRCERPTIFGLLSIRGSIACVYCGNGTIPEESKSRGRRGRQGKGDHSSSAEPVVNIIHDG